MLVMIAAMNQKRTLGLNGSMPWHCPEDLKFFKRITMGETLIMGRKTYDGLPKVLKGRNILKVSRSEGDINDLTQYLKDNETSSETIFVAGGGEVYKASMPYAQKIYLSIIKDETLGDTFFPEIDASEYSLSDTVAFETFTLQIYERIGK